MHAQRKNFQLLVQSCVGKIGLRDSLHNIGILGGQALLALVVGQEQETPKHISYTVEIIYQTYARYFRTHTDAWI
jgi:hypothetical protein